ncbi:glycosyltransferase [uncultured Kiloniella sp.]|uniref:glycosyltransferase n=1 Tax=uncultured Kiloniella sp. TaxID=1133091 RepID=UPI00263A0DDE|nr:glycosyltransferase [uncultured Kiloniella sp.]
MKILLVLGAGGEGGAETFYTHMALAFHRAGIETHAALRQNDNRVNLFKAAGIETQVLPFGKLFDFKTKKGLKQKIKEFKPDVVMTFMNRATSLCPKGDFLHIARLGGYYKLKNYKNCDHLIGNTKDIVDYLTSVGWPAERSHHVPNFASVETDALPVSRSDLNTPDDATVLLALGRLHENKAFDILLRAVEIETRPYVWIAGEGPLREELETLAKELGVSDRVRFLGWRNDRGALLAAADICVFPSRFEPFGSVMIEAWATRTPLVTTRTAGPEEMATDNHDALMVPVDDYKGMAAAITRMMDEKGLAERLTAAGFKTFEKDYTEEACVQNYISLFDKLLAQEKRIAS